MKKVNILYFHIFAVGLGLLILTGLVFPMGNRGEEEEKAEQKVEIDELLFSREAMYYEKLPNKEVQCKLCFRNCLIAEGERGECSNRWNKDGTLYSIIYGKPSAIQIDPVEKEPQYHMLPGTRILCFGTAGCNFRCRFCQNWHLSQRTLEDMEIIYLMPPEAAVEFAIKNEIPTISFTYNEPTSFFEFVYDTARYAKTKGLKILWHSNGGINPEPLRDLLQYTDAVTIDLKGFTEKFYRELSSAELKPVLRTLKIIKEEGVWLEIVNLLIPTLNDDPDDIRRMCEWIKDNLGPQVPLHFSRFHPAYRLTNLPPTPIETLESALHIAENAGLKFLTIGNVPGHVNNSTFCPNCGKILIQRIQYFIGENNIQNGRCRFCGEAIPGIWKE